MWKTKYCMSGVIHIPELCALEHCVKAKVEILLVTFCDKALEF